MITEGQFALLTLTVFILTLILTVQAIVERKGSLVISYLLVFFLLFLAMNTR